MKLKVNTTLDTGCFRIRVQASRICALFFRFEFPNGPRTKLNREEKLELGTYVPQTASFSSLTLVPGP
jgi:hypothetical protein